MGMTDLLVHVGQSRAAEARLDAAVRLAQSCGARLTLLGLAPEPYLASAVGIHMPPELLHQLAAEARAEAERVVAQAVARVASAVPAEGHALTARAEELPGLLAWHARRADLVMVGQPDPDNPQDPGQAFVEAAFMASGRPALVIPYIGTRGPMPPTRAIVAWDGSHEASRAVHDALPLLVKADQGVSLVVVDPDRLAGGLGERPGADMAAHLARHGVRVEVVIVPSGGLRVADELLDRAVDEGAGLLVMGGYGNARLREVVLGGTTRRILQQMTVPVLFSH